VSGSYGNGGRLLLLRQPKGQHSRLKVLLEATRTRQVIIFDVVVADDGSSSGPVECIKRS
jgi:ABC-type siderophore export system fused ATPase/permease subunit